MNTNDNYTRSEWYAPRTPSAPPVPFTAPAPQKPAKSRHTGLKIAAVSVCALLLLVASVYVFSDSFGLNLPFRVSSSDKGDSHSFTFEIPGPSEKEETEPPSFNYDALPDEYDKDYKDFFSKYYSGTQPAASAGSSIEQGGTGSDFRIELQRAVAPEIEQDHAVAVVNGAHGLPVLPDDKGGQVLVDNARLLAAEVFNRFPGAAEESAFAVDHFVRALAVDVYVPSGLDHTPVCLVPVHGDLHPPAAGSDPPFKGCVVQLRQRVFEHIHIVQR